MVALPGSGGLEAVSLVPYEMLHVSYDSAVSKPMKPYIRSLPRRKKIFGTTVKTAAGNWRQDIFCLQTSLAALSVRLLVKLKARDGNFSVRASRKYNALMKLWIIIVVLRYTHEKMFSILSPFP